MAVAQFEDDIKIIEEGMKRLENDYNRFFTGTLDRPPYVLQMRIDRVARHYLENADTALRTAEKFRMASLVSRYQILSEMWSRNVRAIEEGRPSTLDRRHATVSPASPPKGRQLMFSTTLTTAEATPEDARMLGLYRAFAEAQKRAGRETPSISYEKFHRQVSDRLRRLDEEGGARPVVLQIEFVDNRPILKIKSSR